MNNAHTLPPLEGRKGKGWRVDLGRPQAALIFPPTLALPLVALRERAALDGGGI